jgi:serine/threonine-protein kinase
MLEAQSSALLRSTHIVQVFDFGVDANVPYIAMELLNGESLGERLQREVRLSPAATSTILSQVARAMALAHGAGIVHRDLKPDNIFIVKEHDTEIVKVLDFGIAKVTGGSFEATTGGGTKTGSILGTPYYVSPEQARGNKTVDSRSDLWALGVICYECLTGTLPFSSDGLGDLLLQICGDPQPPPSQHTKLPAGLDQWMERALSKSPEQRFQSAEEMATAFQALVSQGDQFVTQPVPTRSGPLQHALSQGLAVTAVPKLDSPSRSKLRVTLSLVAGLAVGAGALGWWHYRDLRALAAAADASARPTTPAAAEAKRARLEPSATPARDASNRTMASPAPVISGPPTALATTPRAKPHASKSRASRPQTGKSTAPHQFSPAPAATTQELPVPPRQPPAPVQPATKSGSAASESTPNVPPATKDATAPTRFFEDRR